MRLLKWQSVFSVAAQNLWRRVDSCCMKSFVCSSTTPTQRTEALHSLLVCWTWRGESIRQDVATKCVIILRPLFLSRCCRRSIHLGGVLINSWCLKEIYARQRRKIAQVSNVWQFKACVAPFGANCWRTKHGCGTAKPTQTFYALPLTQ